jgi:hypothetical protein
MIASCGLRERKTLSYRAPKIEDGLCLFARDTGCDMSRLSDEPFEKVADDKDIQATLAVEHVWGTVQCNNCKFWGRMDGYIEPGDDKFIKFVCPKCNCVERVRNPEAM